MARSHEPESEKQWPAELPLADLEALAMQLIESEPSKRRSEELRVVVGDLVRRAGMTDREKLVIARERFPTVDIALDSIAAEFDVHVRKVAVDRGSPEDEQLRRRMEESHAMALRHPLPSISAEEVSRMLLGDDVDQELLEGS